MMDLNQTKDYKRPLIVGIRKPTLSNASRKINLLRLRFPLYYKYKKLIWKFRSKAGRSKSGRITTFSKGPRARACAPTVNTSFRLNSLFFMGGLTITGFSKKISSLVFTSRGEVSYIPQIHAGSLFHLNKYSKIRPKSPNIFKELLTLKPYIQINMVPFLLLQQFKNVKISQLELSPLRTIKFVRSIGVSALLLKLDTRTGLGLVKLPSGIKKVFSAFSLCSTGPAYMHLQKKFLSSTKSSDFRKTGIKSRVRGVAKNPVDHPHGGRTNSIKYPRTP